MIRPDGNGRTRSPVLCHQWCSSLPHKQTKQARDNRECVKNENQVGWDHVSGLGHRWVVDEQSLRLVGVLWVGADGGGGENVDLSSLFPIFLFFIFYFFSVSSNK